MVRLGLLVVVLGLPVTGLAAEPTEFVQAKVTQLTELLKKKEPADKQAPVLDELFDFAAMSEAALGSEWGPRTAAEKSEFSDLFKQHVSQQAVKALQKTLSASDVSYAESKGTVTLKAKVKPKAVELAFKVVEVNGALKVVDLVTDASLVSGARSQFTKIIKKEGFPKLVQTLKSKVTKG